jgi:hypothetical protein
MPCVFVDNSPELLVALFSSLPVDYLMRQKLGGTNMTYFYIEQLPIPKWNVFDDRCTWSAGHTLKEWFDNRVIELVHTAHDTTPIAESIGYSGSPFRWDPERRAHLRAELDAAVFHIYGYERDDVDYILGTFPIVNRQDVERFGEERTRRLVLEAYGALAAATVSGQPYQSPLTPSPGDGPRHH